MNTDVLHHLAALRERLNLRRLELQAEIAATRDLYPLGDSAGSGEVSDRKDDAGRLQLSEVTEAAEQRDLEEVRQIDKALERIENGSYGTCRECGNAIALQRLMVQPEAERCLECQTNLETEH